MVLDLAVTVDGRKDDSSVIPGLQWGGERIVELRNGLPGGQIRKGEQLPRSFSYESGTQSSVVADWTGTRVVHVRRRIESTRRHFLR